MGKVSFQGNLSFNELQKFAEQSGDKSIRLKEKDGIKTLYTSDKISTKLKDFLSGKTDGRRDAAKVELSRLLGQHGVDTSLLSIPTEGKIKGGQLSHLVGGAKKQVESNAKAANEKMLTTEAKDAERSQASKKGEKAEVLHALKWKDPSDLKAAAGKLGNHLAKVIDQRASGKAPNEASKFKMEFLSLHGETLIAKKNEYLKSCAREFEGYGGAFDTTYEHASPEIKKLVDDVFTHAAENLAGNKTLDDKGRQIEINGTKYTFEKKLGEGGNGAVHLYRSESGESIAVKRPINIMHAQIAAHEQELSTATTPDVREKAIEKLNQLKAPLLAYHQELEAHLRVDGQGHIVGLKGAVMGKNGELMIALELAPHGDIAKVQENLYATKDSATASIPESKIILDNTNALAKSAAALTLLQDMAHGLLECHNSGVVHMDVKPQNFMVGQGGIAKLADFGTSGGTVKVDVNNGDTVGAEISITKRPVDKPLWLAPETIHGTDIRNKDVVDAIESKKSVTRRQIAKRLGIEINPKTRQERRMELRNQIGKNVDSATKIKMHEAIDVQVDEQMAKEKAKFEVDVGGPKAKKKFEKLMGATNRQNAQKIEMNTPSIVIDDKADVWSFGIVAYQMLFNKGNDLPPGLHNSWDNQVEKRLKEFHSNSNNRVFTTDLFEGSVEGTELDVFKPTLVAHLTPEHEFVNWLLNPDPGQRPSMSDVLKHPIFKRLGVGSDEAYEFIEALKKSPDELMVAKMNLEQVSG